MSQIIFITTCYRSLITFCRRKTVNVNEQTHSCCSCLEGKLCIFSQLITYYRGLIARGELSLGRVVWHSTVLQATIVVLGSTRGFSRLKSHQICDFILWPFSSTVSGGVSFCNGHSYLISHSLKRLLKWKTQYLCRSHNIIICSYFQALFGQHFILHFLLCNRTDWLFMEQVVSKENVVWH